MKSGQGTPIIDHPQPGSGLLILMALFLIGFLAAIPAVMLAEAGLGIRVLVSILLVIFSTILVYGFWLLQNTWYQADHEGIGVKFGPAEVNFLWSEFREVRYKPGLFGLKIGWARVTPCVRLRNALVFRRERSSLPLFLTPSDPEDFLERIRLVRPGLVK